MAHLEVVGSSPTRVVVILTNYLDRFRHVYLSSSLVEMKISIDFPSPSPSEMFDFVTSRVLMTSKPGSHDFLLEENFLADVSPY